MAAVHPLIYADGHESFGRFGDLFGGIGIGSEAFVGFQAVDQIQTAFFLAEVVLVAVVFPALDVLVDEAGITEFFEVSADLLVADAVVEPLVDLVAEGLWEFADFTGGLAL